MQIHGNRDVLVLVYPIHKWKGINLFTRSDWGIPFFDN